MKHKAALMICISILMLLLVFQGPLLTKILNASASPAWPSSWILVDTDKNEDGTGDDMRDVKYAYYQYDADYLYLKLTCYAMPGSEWPHGGARYKWFIDLDKDMYYSGGNIFNAEYLLFVEDTDSNGVGEIYLLFDANNDGSFSEYEPWPPANYANYRITDSNIASFRIISPYDIEMYIRWASIGAPPSYQLFWATDQENPNLDQGPSTDRVDEEVPLAVHNVAATSQTAFPTTVKQGEHVAIQVVTENSGTLAETFNVTCYFNNSAIGTLLVANLAAAHQTTLNFDWDTTGIPEGVYTIKAWADSSAAITETDETDNWCTYPATVTIQSALAHDVAAVSQVPDKISVVQGTIVNINVTVSNLGDFAETFNVTCFYGNTPIGYSTLTSMPNKTSTNIIFAWNTSGVTPDLYHILAMVDSSRIITEIDEDNNNCTSLEVVTVYSSSQMGKLDLDKVKTSVISGEDPPVVGQTTVYELTIIVTNIGGSNLTNVKVNETISSDVTFISTGSPSQGSIVSLPPPKLVWNLGTLVPGGIANLTFRVSATPSTLSTVHLNHKGDLIATGTDKLGNTVNATGITDITVQPIIRDVAATSQIPSKTVVWQGETISIQVVVNNYGNITETFDVTCYYNNTQIGVMRVYNLEAGQSTIISFPWDTTGISPNVYSIKAKADSNDEIPESNETNNICTYPSTVEVVIHDVAVLSQTPSPATVIQGETLNVQVLVRNEGTEPETFNVSCYLNETFSGKQSVTDLQPGQTTTVTFSFATTSIQPGIYFINAYASIITGETDTIDNACKSTVSVQITLPQYQITFTQNGLDISATGTILTVNGTSKTYADLPYIVPANASTIITYAYQNASSTTTGKRFILTSVTGSTSPITVTGNATVTGNYKTQYLLTVTTTPSALTPQPTRNPIGELAAPSNWWYDAATTVTLTAQPVTGYQFVEWTIDGVSKGNGVNPTSATINSPHTAIASYIQTTSLSISITPMNSMISLGQSVSFTSTVSGGTLPYTFQWYLDGNPIPGATSGTWAFTPTAPDIYFVYLKVTDSSNNTASSDTARVVVSNLVPVGGYTISYSRQEQPMSITIYLLLIGMFCAFLTSFKRRKK